MSDILPAWREVAGRGGDTNLIHSVQMKSKTYHIISCHQTEEPRKQNSMLYFSPVEKNNSSENV